MGTTIDSIKDLNRQSAVMDAENLSRLERLPAVDSTRNGTRDPEIVFVTIPTETTAQSLLRSETFVSPSIDVRIDAPVRATSRVVKEREVEPTNEPTFDEQVETPTNCEPECAEHHDGPPADELAFSSIESNHGPELTRVSTSEEETQEKENDGAEITGERVATPSLDASEPNPSLSAMIDNVFDTDTKSKEISDDSPRASLQPAHWIDIKTEPTDEPTETELDNSERLADLMVDRILQLCPSTSAWCVMLTGVDDVIDSTESAELISRTFAQRGLGQVLLIDADVNHKSLTTRYKHRDVDGLADVINNHADPTELIQKTETENLDFLPCGLGKPWRQNSGASRMAKLSSRLKQDYAYVFVAGETADSWLCQSMSSQCDATFLVVSLDETDATLAKGAIDELRLYGARLLGCIVAE